MHVECAWRAGFHLELNSKIDLKEKIKEKHEKLVNKLYCEPHWPFKLIQEIQEKRK